jgi:hypothetical protein
LHLAHVSKVGYPDTWSFGLEASSGKTGFLGNFRVLHSGLGEVTENATSRAVGEYSSGRFSKDLVSVGSPSMQTGSHVSVHSEDAALRGRVKGTKAKML